MGDNAKNIKFRSRMDKVVKDIIFNFSVKPRLSSERGNAILVGQFSRGLSKEKAGNHDGRFPAFIIPFIVMDGFDTLMDTYIQ